MITKKDKYYTYDMANHKTFFKTKAEADRHRKKLYNNMAIWLKLYRVSPWNDTP